MGGRSAILNRELITRKRTVANVWSGARTGTTTRPSLTGQKRKYITPEYIRGVIIILGVWIAWYPAAAVFFIVDLLLTGARGGAVPVHAIHVMYRYGLWILTLGFIAILPIAFWRATAAALAMKQGPLISKLGASACALAVV